MVYYEFVLTNKNIRIHFARKSNIIYDSNYQPQLKTATVIEASEKKDDDNDFNDGAEEVVTLCFDLNFEEEKTINICVFVSLSYTQ